MCTLRNGEVIGPRFINRFHTGNANRALRKVEGSPGSSKSWTHYMSEGQPEFCSQQNYKAFYPQRLRAYLFCVFQERGKAVKQ